MTVADYTTHRNSIFYPKTDEPVNHTRHEILKRGSLVYRYSKSPDQPDQSMHVEQMVAEEAWKIGFPTPRIQTHSTATQTYQMMKCAVGETLAEVTVPHVREKALTSLGKALAQLHTIKTFDYGFIVTGHNRLGGVHLRWIDYLNTKWCDHLNALTESGLLTSVQALDASRWMNRFVDANVVVNPVLLHGDLNSHNVFVDEVGFVTNLIDWEDALSGDPIFDLASWATFTFVQEIDLQTLLKSYYTFAAKPKDFDLRFWTYFLRISVSKLVLLHRYGHTDLARGKSRIERALEVLETIK